VETTLTQPARWSLTTLIAFRFFFVYFVFYILPFPFYWIPYAGMIVEPFTRMSFAATELLGRTIFGVAYILPPANTGSGDTMHNYVQLVFVLLFATVGTIVWSVVDTRRNNYEKLLFWFMILLRYYLAVVMISYGLSKIFRIQFPPLTIHQLTKSYGDSSPMNLLWTFMSYSGPYTVFTGLGEAVGGVLLFFRRTRLLGVILIAIIMSHIVMLNLAYDVPVKLYSSHLLIISLLIMGPDMKRLLNLLILNKPVEPAPMKPLYVSQRAKWIYLIGKALIVIYVVSQLLINTFDQLEDITQYFASVSREDSLNGQYEVETFILNNDTLPAIQTDTRRWKGMMIRDKIIELESMDGASASWHFLGNVGYRRIVIHSPELSTAGNFTFRADSTRIVMEGTLNSDTLTITARKKKEGSQFLLVERGFHWVNEYPFNK
jgi:uncharacterized membrane protein YphA (DoxX/SURF4 family)